MKNLLKILFYIVGFIFILFLYKYRSKKFSFIKEEKIIDYPIRRYKIGSLILLLWMGIILYGVIYEIIFNQSINSKVFIVPFILSVIYELFGSTPTVLRSDYGIDVTLDFINSGSLGVDLLGSWVGEYNSGLIVYFYLIDYSSINVTKISKDEIIFTGKEKRENIPIKVKLKSKKSIEYVYPLLKMLKG